VTRELTGRVHVCLGDAAPTSYTYVLGEALTCELLLKFSDTRVPVLCAYAELFVLLVSTIVIFLLLTKFIFYTCKLFTSVV
jgi:hypothetical protein